LCAVACCFCRTQQLHKRSRRSIIQSRAIHNLRGRRQQDNHRTVTGAKETRRRLTPMIFASARCTPLILVPGARARGLRQYLLLGLEKVTA
jgi:hypothetical protein